MTIIIYCDGLCEPINPNGIATYGFIIYGDENMLHNDYGLVGVGQEVDHAVAEYAAMCKALEYLISQGLVDEEVTIRSDSKQIVYQMSGKQMGNKGLYLPWFRKACYLHKNFRQLEYTWISRDENKEADALTWRAYEEHCKAKGIEPKYQNNQP